MNTKPIIISPEDRQEALNVIGVKVSLLASNPETGGPEVTLQSGEEGMGPPPHSHPWDETFYVLRGQVEFQSGGETTVAGQGTLVHVPGGTVHGFRFGPEGGEMLELTSKGSKASKMFTALSREIPPGPPEIGKVLDIFQRHDVTAHLG